MTRLYGRLAKINIKNNHRFYLPYLLTGMLSAAMFYLVLAMVDNPGLAKMTGGAEIALILALGVFVIGVFVSIFLFYTNSFIIKRRKKELGVYNILGMEKKHIAKVLFLETLFTAVVSISGGLAFGILFQKLLTMLLYRLMQVEQSIPFYISTTACANTVKLFLLIYGASLLYNLMQMKLSNPIELLHGSNAGEREPKTKLLMTIIGLATLGGGYYIALTVRDAMNAILMFFVAVLLVIAGTYCLFTAGSIAFLKLLRKNKGYYYRPRHFTTVSGMIYRMKQNAVGLANICILSTMVLVTVSTTVAMYAGMEDSLIGMYPEEISVDTYFSELPEQKDAVSGVVRDSLAASGRTILIEKDCLYANFTVLRQGTDLTLRKSGSDYDSDQITILKLLTPEGYEVYTGEPLGCELLPGEAAVAANPLYEEDTINVEGMAYTVKKNLTLPMDAEGQLSLMSGTCCLVLPDEAAMNELFGVFRENWDQERVDPRFVYEMSLETDGTNEEKITAENALAEAVSSWEETNAQSVHGYKWSKVTGRAQNRYGAYALYGGMFFLGLFLGLMFLMVTVLIIFYKQISEGYEDKERFAIMQKVGMSSAEVKHAIRSQVLTVFFLPLVAAVIHVAMAFPMITLMLEAISLTNVRLFAWCVAGTALIFGIIYLAVFLLTSRTYYKIVGNQV